MIIGLIGKENAKTNVIEFLNSAGFTPFSFKKESLKHLHIDTHYVVSLSHPDEIEMLKNQNGFSFFSIAIDPEKTKNWPASDHTVSHNETWQENIKKIVLDLLKNQSRPDWDTYFMNIAKVTSLRSNCLKRRVAAIIVKDQRIISTGYNGTPRGIKNCNEGGCSRCNSFAKSGTSLGECLCSHAEENAIVQSAYHGVSIKDATLYTTFSPCLMCTKMILNSGIKEVVYNAHYPLGEGPLKLLQEAHVVARQLGTS